MHLFIINMHKIILLAECDMDLTESTTYHACMNEIFDIDPVVSDQWDVLVQKIDDTHSTEDKAEVFDHQWLVMHTTTVYSSSVYSMWVYYENRGSSLNANILPKFLYGQLIKSCNLILIICIAHYINLLYIYIHFYYRILLF